MEDDGDELVVLVGSDSDEAPRRSRSRRALLAMGVCATAVAGGVAVVALTGAGDSGSDFPRAAVAYDGPLVASGRYGAAGQAIDCVNPPTGSDSSADVYGEGATSATARGAVETAYSEGLFLSMPSVDLAVAATEPDRQLWTYEVDGTVLFAVVVHDGPATEGAGGDGWYVETVARCDFAEFPADDAELGGLVRYGTWTDAGGVPVPVAEVYSTPGPEHCGWEDMTFLILGDGSRRGSSIYIEDPIAGLRDDVSGPYRTDIEVPDDARDTGWEREGSRLWLSADGGYAYVGSASSADAWPRFDTGCA